MQVIVVIMYALISIHALLAESDTSRDKSIKITRNFYPRSPCGERPRIAWEAHQAGKISIHALLAESDAAASFQPSREKISIHALLAESDESIGTLRTVKVRFLSTLSLRRATYT